MLPLIPFIIVTYLGYKGVKLAGKAWKKGQIEAVEEHEHPRKSWIDGVLERQAAAEEERNNLHLKEVAEEYHRRHQTLEETKVE